jgi:hypothetical protein
MFNYACGIKEKVITNALRAMGFLFSDLDFDFLIDKVVPYINANILQHLDPKLKQQDGSFKLEKAIQESLVVHLDSKSPKITWNACIVISKIL